MISFEAEKEGFMNGIQIRHLLELIETQTENRDAVTRHEVAEYLKNHLDEVAAGLSEKGVFLIPTTQGEIELSEKYLRLAVAS